MLMSKLISTRRINWLKAIKDFQESHVDPPSTFQDVGKHCSILAALAHVKVINKIKIEQHENKHKRTVANIISDL